MIRSVKCPICGIEVRYDDSLNMENEYNDYARTSLEMGDGSKRSSHIKYIVCPECGSDVDVAVLNIHFNPEGERMSMEVVYY